MFGGDCLGRVGPRKILDRCEAVAALAFVTDHPRGQHFVAAWIRNAWEDLLAFRFNDASALRAGDSHGGIYRRERNPHER